MSLSLIDTALLLGVFVFFAGGYGVLYSVGKIKQSSNWIYVSYVCYSLQVFVTVMIVLFGPLGIGWQLLIIASCIACLRIPPMAFSYLELTHG